MALKILVNTVWKNAVELRVTDSSHAETSDGSGKLILAGGPPHLKWTQSGTAERRFYYINKSATLEADAFVMWRADRHLTHSLTVLSYSDFTTTADSNIFSSSNFAETLVGANADAWVYEFSARSTKEAFGFRLTDGTGGAYVKSLGQCYFCSAFTVNYPVSMEVKPLGIRDSVKKGKNFYRVSEQIGIELEGLTDAETVTLEDILTDNDGRTIEEPFYLYDSGAAWLTDKLVPVILGDRPIKKEFNDLYSLQLQLYRLEEYPNAN